MDYSALKIGDQAPLEINVVIEIPQGSAIKYEFDPLTGAMAVDRLIGSSLAYPFHYGFIPETLAPDGDALDAIIISGQPAKTKDMVVCRPIGLLSMADEHGQDAKIICVPINEIDPQYAKISDLPDIDEPILEKIKLFFAQYKEAENDRWSSVQSYGAKAEALAAISQAQHEAEK